MTRYRRRALEREENAAALTTSLALGAGVAAIAFYVVRLLLSRDPLSDADTGGGRPGTSDTIPGTEVPDRALPAGGRARGG